MIDVEDIAEKVIILFQGGRLTIEGAKRRELTSWVQGAIADIGRQEYFENYKAGNQAEVNSAWIVPFKLPITIDPVTSYSQAVLTEKPISLPKNRGFVSVTGMNGENYEPVTMEYYRQLRNSSLYKFAQGPFYSAGPGKVYILPECNKPIKDTEVTVWLAVANDATYNDSMVLLIYQRILPMLQVRFGTKPDMITDQNPNK